MGMSVFGLSVRFCGSKEVGLLPDPMIYSGRQLPKARDQWNFRYSVEIAMAAVGLDMDNIKRRQKSEFKHP